MTIESWIGPIVAMVATFIAIATMTIVARKIGLVDLPDQRKAHSGEVPLVGGVSIGFVLILLTMVLPLPDKIFWAFLGFFVLILTGLYDDFYGSTAKQRLVVQLLVALLVIFFMEARITDLGSYLGREITLPTVASEVFTALALIGLMNAFNLVDGIDGLASGLVIVALALIVSYQVLFSHLAYFEWLISLLVSVTVFWLVNLNVTPLEKIFLGDAGSVALGFLIAWLLIDFSQGLTPSLPPESTIWFVAYPVLDTLTVIMIRLRMKVPIFQADRRHFHHRLLDNGLSQQYILFGILGLCLLIPLFIIFLTSVMGSWVSICGFILLLTVLTRLSWKYEVKQINERQTS